MHSAEGERPQAEGDLSVGDLPICDLVELPPSSSVQQKTLKTSIHCNGIGLHSGEKIALSLYPAEIDTGVVFRRTDLRNGHREVVARFDNVSDTRLCTSLTNEVGTKVGTVEHLMAALAGCEIDNVEIELNGPEVPIMDGSAEPFVFLIECAGVVEQNAPRRAIQILKPVVVRAGDAVARMEPASDFSVQLGIEFDNPMIGAQEMTVDVSQAVFKSEICRARTFGLLEDVEALRKAGLAKGGSLDNAVVVSDDRILNDGGLRYKDEFVRHKVLDCIGDLYLAGGPIVGRFVGQRAGHRVNHLMLHAIFADEDAWCYADMDMLPSGELNGWSGEPAAAVA